METTPYRTKAERLTALAEAAERSLAGHADPTDRAYYEGRAYAFKRAAPGGPGSRCPMDDRIVVNISRHERSDLVIEAVAVCVQPYAYATEVLAVCRREDPTILCMPGGKVDRGESARSAAIRELREETGLVRAPRNLAWLGAVNVAGRNGGSLTVAVFWTLADPDYVPGPTMGEPDLDPHWHDWAELADASKHGRFAGPAMLSRIEMKVKP